MRDNFIFDLDFELGKTNKQIDRAVTRLNTLRGKWKGLMRAKILAQNEKDKQRQNEIEQNRQIDDLELRSIPKRRKRDSDV